MENIPFNKSVETISLSEKIPENLKGNFHPGIIPMFTITETENKIRPKSRSQDAERDYKKSACDRERTRMRDMNKSFDNLRNILQSSKRIGKKLSKIETLRGAIAYIKSLEAQLRASPKLKHRSEYSSDLYRAASSDPESTPSSYQESEYFNCSESVYK